jgi:hypothetical protein
MALSELELRHIVERGFLPIQCRCNIDSLGEVSIELIDPSTGSNLAASGIPKSRLDTCRGIASFVAEMKAQLGTGSLKAQASNK